MSWTVVLLPQFVMIGCWFLLHIKEELWSSK